MITSVNLPVCEIYYPPFFLFLEVCGTAAAAGARLKVAHCSWDEFTRTVFLLVFDVQVRLQTFDTLLKFSNTS